MEKQIKEAVQRAVDRAGLKVDVNTLTWLSQEAWRTRNEQKSGSAVLHLLIEGTDLYHALNGPVVEPGKPYLMDALLEELRPLGLYYEQGYAWSVHFHWIDCEKKQAICSPAEGGEESKPEQEEDATPRTYTFVTPKGLPVVGTSERLLGTACVRGFIRKTDGSLEPDYTGDTEVNWDTQETILNEDGEVLVVDSEGGEWPLSNCIPYEFFKEETGDYIAVDRSCPEPSTAGGQWRIKATATEGDIGSVTSTFTTEKFLREKARLVAYEELPAEWFNAFFPRPPPPAAPRE